MTNTSRKIHSPAVGPIGATICLFALSATMAAAADCEPHWDNTVGQPGLDSTVRAMAAFDDGSGGGLALYAGGRFTTAGGMSANRIAKWDGSSWSPLGTGIAGTGNPPQIVALAVFDDGSGPALYAGGRFSIAGDVEANKIAKWGGEAWSPLGAGMGGIHGIPKWVRALAVFDDGSGSALYVGGDFRTAGDVDAWNIAKWNGEEWSALGTNLPMSYCGTVRAMAVFDDGSGPALYVGGTFDFIGDLEVNKIAKWDGEEWSALGSGMNSTVRALTVFDDGSGPALYAGGAFTVIGDMEVNHIAKWDGNDWSPLGTGMGGDPDSSPTRVFALTVFDDGTGGGPALYAGGNFTTAGGVSANNIAKWDGSLWSPLGTGMDSPGQLVSAVYALMAFDDDSPDGGPVLYAAGNSQIAGALPIELIGAWRGCATDSIPGDLNGDGVVNVDDLLIVLNNWGLCDDCDDCPADITGDCAINVDDLLMVLNNWD